MSIYRVPADQWAEFCSRFTRQHRGEGLTVASLSGASEEAGEHGALDELRIEQHDGRLGVMVQMTGTPRGIRRFGIEDLTRIELAQYNEKRPGNLTIGADENGTELVLRFDAPLFAGELDGFTERDLDDAYPTVDPNAGGA